MENRLARKSLVISIFGVLLLPMAVLFGPVSPLIEFIGFIVMLWGIMTAISSLYIETRVFGEKWYAVIALVLLAIVIMIVSWF